MLSKLATAIAKAVGPHSADSSNTMAFHIATDFALEPGCQIFLRRLQLARRIFAKHPWTIDVFKRIIAAYENMGVLGAIAVNSTAPLMDPCPPLWSGCQGEVDQSKPLSVGSSGFAHHFYC